jgi:hypothetical protein
MRKTINRVKATAAQNVPGEPPLFPATGCIQNPETIVRKGLNHMTGFRIKTLLCVCAAFVSIAGAAAAELSPDEKSAGWKLLFDGSSTAGWRSLGKKEFPEKGWEVQEGCLHHIAKGGGGDITYTDPFENFELTFEWKAAPGANSGVKYRVEDKPGSAFGPEYQVIDDAKHPDAKNAKRTSGALYDIFAPAPEKVLKPAGEFNTSKIVVKGNHLEHWLNDVKLVEAEVGSDTWKSAIAASKFAKKPEFGSNASGQICLQDHGDEVWYRNIRIHPLPAK